MNLKSYANMKNPSAVLGLSSGQKEAEALSIPSL